MERLPEVFCVEKRVSTLDYMSKANGEAIKRYVRADLLHKLADALAEHAEYTQEYDARTDSNVYRAKVHVLVKKKR